MTQTTDLKKRLAALSRPLTLTVTSGKGGVGKSVISLSLAVKHASDGIRTLLIDADLGLGNQHILTGQMPVFTIEDVLAATCSLEESILSISENFSLLPAGSGFSDADWRYAHSVEDSRTMLEWLKANFDLIIVDSGAGISSKVTTVARLSDIVLLVTTPDIAAVADSYAVAKYLLTADPSARLGFTVNRADTDQEGKRTSENLRLMMEKFLKHKIPATSHICEHRGLRSIVLNHSILTAGFGDSQWSDSIEVTGRMLTACIPPDLSLWTKAHWGARDPLSALNLKSVNDDIINIASEPTVNSVRTEGSLLTSRKDSL